MILSIFIFCLVLFFYLHIQFHLKVCNDLEILELENESKGILEEICDLRQPVIFNLEDEFFNPFRGINKSFIKEKFYSFDVKIRENNYSIEIDSNTDLYFPLQLQLGIKLFDQIKSKNYYSENNIDFLKETGILKVFQKNDFYFRPPLVSNCNYDLMFGSEDSFTPFRYNINYRNYFIVSEGKAKLKLSPPKYIKDLNLQKDYENYEFRSPINPWNPQEKYLNDFNKIKCLEIVLTPGKCFFIPAYWIYSFQFEKDTSICCLYYNTLMNNITNIPEIAMYTLQNTNIEHKIIKNYLNSNSNSLINKKDDCCLNKIEEKEKKKINNKINSENNKEIINI